MVDRPFSSVRPFGPIFSAQEASADTEEVANNDSVSIDDPVLKQAEDWYESVSKEENKRKMMKNYFMSISELSEAEVDRKLDEAGL